MFTIVPMKRKQSLYVIALENALAYVQSSINEKNAKFISVIALENALAYVRSSIKEK
jgi:hypothetical protein